MKKVQTYTKAQISTAIANAYKGNAAIGIKLTSGLDYKKQYTSQQVINMLNSNGVNPRHIAIINNILLNNI